MMSQRLATAIEELRAEETRIQADLDELRQRVKSGETQLKQIQRALSVLDEKPRSKSANQKPAATRQEVIGAMTEILDTNGSVGRRNSNGSSPTSWSLMVKSNGPRTSARRKHETTPASLVTRTVVSRRGSLAPTTREHATGRVRGFLEQLAQLVCLVGRRHSSGLSGRPSA